MTSIRSALMAAVFAASAAAVGAGATGDDADRVVLRGNVHPLVSAAADAGPADAEHPLSRMVLVLARRPGGDAALEAFLADQRDPSSPLYHRWLSPEEFGERFGINDGDLQRVIDWLQEEGFAVDEIARGRGWIDFSGTVGQVERAFGAPIREYEIDGERHRANAADPSIPRYLSGSVAGIVSLHDFRRRSERAAVPTRAPEITSVLGAHSLGPADFARIYDLEPLYQQGIDGRGKRIGIVGRVEINPADIASFRSKFGLPAGNPTIVVNGPDPGFWDKGEEQEAVLDVEWSGAVAPGAAVTLVVSKSTDATDGVDLSAQYIVDHDLADVMSTSFGACEADLGAAGLAFYASVWGQAAAEGITSFVSSGDSGFAGCDSPGDAVATGSGVSGLCSSYDNVCVGGTLFDDRAQPDLYWTKVSDAVTGLSAISYIPEVGWNESGAVPFGRRLLATGGGPSQERSKPWWQRGPGVPADGKRDVPDVSLAAAIHDGYFIYQSDNGGNATIGGTSASSPAMAGIMALIVQKTGERQGNANPVFYALAAAQTDGTGPTVFHDVIGGSNDVPGLVGFSCGPGYDLVTGVGSVDAFALASHWETVAPPTDGTPRPTSITPVGTSAAVPVRRSHP